MGNLEASPQLCKVTLACRRCGGEGYMTRSDLLRGQDWLRWSSVTVEPNGVDCGRDGSSAVAPPLLFCLFVSEWFALCEPEDVIGFLAPVPVGSSLKGAERAGSERPGCSSGATMLTAVVELTFASKELSWRRGSTSTCSSFIRRNGTLVWKTKSFSSDRDPRSFKTTFWVGHTFLWALGKVCGVPSSFLFFGVLTSVSSSRFRFLLVPVIQEETLRLSGF